MVLNIMVKTTTYPMIDSGFFENLYQLFCTAFLLIPNFSMTVSPYSLLTAIRILGSR